MTVVINPAGLQRLMHSVGVQREIAEKTARIYVNAAVALSGGDGVMRGVLNEHPELLQMRVQAGEGLVWLERGGHGGHGKLSLAEKLRDKELKEDPGWFTKAILGDPPLTETGFRRAGVQ